MPKKYILVTFIFGGLFVNVIVVLNSVVTTKAVDVLACKVINP